MHKRNAADLPDSEVSLSEEQQPKPEGRAVNVAVRREKQRRNGTAGRYDRSFGRVQKGLTLWAPLRSLRVTTNGKSATRAQRAKLLRFSCQDPLVVRFSPRK